MILAERAGCKDALFGLEPGAGGRSWGVSGWEVRLAGDIVVEV